MARPKKSETAAKEKKAKDNGKSTIAGPEYSVFQDYILNGIIPYIEENLQTIETIISAFNETTEISKEDWTTLYNIADHLCDISDGKALLAFDRRYMTGKYTKSEHSVHYKVLTKEYGTYMYNHIQRAKELNKDDEKELKFYQAALYLVAQHLFFFVNVKEK